MANVQLKNARSCDYGIDVEALVDTGSVFLCIPESVQTRLQLEKIDTKAVIVADDRQIIVPYVGPIEIHFKNRIAFAGAVVFGSQVLLGMIPMADMDLIAIPKTREIDVNPESPNIARVMVKSAAHK